MSSDLKDKKMKIIVMIGKSKDVSLKHSRRPMLEDLSLLKMNTEFGLNQKKNKLVQMLTLLIDKNSCS
ncbi:hypothetical protein [Maridesulfovibrio ferrireducens]|uniref:hypothetical protein n=1 Tax=Maridesulfovibrio ferrireducens TaxID=246191 RepID=UPI001A2391AD|nr:hypothetical protein [Maridesulfovibrio ferrireducens]MBI9113096.1 hypothetical protein [Maridesulfovibrio ferrireducens]